MHTRKQAMYKGVGMMISFTVVLVLMFMPVIDGHNPMAYMDNLYNSISKGSAYYIPKTQEAVDAYQGAPLAVTLNMESPQQAERLRGVWAGQGMAAAATGNQVAVSGSLNALLSQALVDADIMYGNDAERMRAKYGYNERQVMYDWWSALKALEYELNKQRRFDAAKLVTLVQAKAVETAYNYYGITAESISNKIGIVLLSLVFYVVYTLWYGFGIMYLFEGWGMHLGH